MSGRDVVGDPALGPHARSASTTVLVAFDGSERCRCALEHVARLLPGAQVLVLVVHEPAVPTGAGIAVGALAPAPAPDDAERRAEELERHARAIAGAGAEHADRLGLRAAALTAAGGGTAGTWTAVCAAAEEHDADLIVVGARHKSAFAAALMGSVCDGVVHHARRPVLVVPDPPE